MLNPAKPPRAGAVLDDSASNGASIELRQLAKFYGGVAAVDDISLDIRPGEFMTLLGPSGSGKTTTLNMIAGFEEMDRGQILLNDSDVSSVPPHRRNLGVVFQHYALFPHLTVEQNIAYPLRERRVAKKEIERRIGEVLDLVNLTGRNRDLPDQLSGGQQQRVALARAIVFRPAALLLDEPLGALDRKLRASLQVEIQQIHRNIGSTFVFVTHDQEEALTLSDRITLFREGRIEQVGTPKDLYDNPITYFAAEFLGEVNTFAGGTWSRGLYTWAGHRFASQGSAEGTPNEAERILIVRPERMNIAVEESDVPDAANRVRARVRDVVFVGDHFRVRLDLPDGVAGLARLDTHDAEKCHPGQDVWTWWLAADQRVVLA
ncbi:ABC transporter ATP-binding protein [Microbacterium soli]|uniref:ABC transporter ATP-binding protein n=1 Tax=Microbacterium soli TaxID=446075 RepID=A0ABP7NLN4_9MICO